MQVTSALVKLVHDSRPTIQVDYCFLVSEETQKKTTVLTACDVSTGMTMSAGVEEKGVNDYAQHELARFVLECGRGGGVLQPGVVQSDQEPAIRKLLRKVCGLTGMSLRHAPVYTSRSQGAVERWHRTL